MRQIRDIGLIGLIEVASLTSADICGPLAESARPLAEGVPEVSVVRLEGLLKQNLGESDWGAVAEKLLEAMVAANQTADAFKLLEDPRLRQSPSANFWRAQLLASSHREAEALALYRQIAADRNSSLGSDALLGAAEMLQPLGRNDHALQIFPEFLHD